MRGGDEREGVAGRLHPIALRHPDLEELERLVGVGDVGDVVALHLLLGASVRLAHALRGVVRGGVPAQATGRRQVERGQGVAARGASLEARGETQRAAGGGGAG